MYIWKLLNSWLLLITIFITRERVYFNRDYAKIRILKCYHLEEKFFKDCRFLKWLKETSLKSFICDIPGEMFKMVRILYFNINYVGMILTNKVNTHQIHLSLKDFTEMCNLLCIDSKYEVEGNGFSYF